MNYEQKTQALEYLDLMDKKIERRNQVIILLCVLLMLYVL